MTDTLKVLGQSIPAANTLTALYTVPAATSTTISSIIICNQAANNAMFRISIAVAGVADATKQYLYYDLFLDGNDTFIATVGLSLTAADVVRVRSDTGNVSFNLFGVEIT